MTPHERALPRYRAVLADMDGTMFRGDELIPGAREAYTELSARGVCWLFLSNNATGPASELAAKLNRLGVPVTTGQVVNSASALVRALQGNHKGIRLLVVGETGLRRAVSEAGAILDDDPLSAELVVVALDREFSYEKLSRAGRCIRGGARFWATNRDPGYPVGGDVLPGAGSLVAAVSVASGRDPDRVFGKPEPDMALLSLETLQVRADQCLVVGDRMETDILFARNAGMASALVFTGVTAREDLPRFGYAPDHMLDSIADIGTLFPRDSSHAP
ncbi:MAG: HAD-IIA family hydrolase [Thermodesulfobacteriota bacterium]